MLGVLVSVAFLNVGLSLALYNYVASSGIQGRSTKREAEP